MPGNFGGVLDGTSTSAWGRNDLKGQGLVAGYTKVVGSSLFNETRFSWSRGVSDGRQDPFGESGMAIIGFKGVPDDPITVKRKPLTYDSTMRWTVSRQKLV